MERHNSIEYVGTERKGEMNELFQLRLKSFWFDCYEL